MPAPAAYANLQLVRPARPSVASLKANANLQRDAETRVKRKVEQAHAILCNLEARSSRLSAQIKELQQRKAAAERRASRIEDRILTRMHEDGLEKLTGLRVTFTMRPAQTSVVVDDVKLIPVCYLREKATREPDKVALKQAIERNEDVPGVHLAQTVSLVRK